MAFTYPFQKVLDVKANEKKQAETQLAQAIGEIVEAEQALAHWEAAREDMLQRLQKETVQGQTMAGLVACQDYISYIDERIAQASGLLREAEAKAERLRDALLERAVEEKVWQKAKEKAYEKYVAESERLLQNELDEIATVRSRSAGVTFS